LLLLFSVVLFLTTEMWQVFAGMNDATLAATGALLVVVGSTFLVVRLPREVDRIERDVASGPTLERRQRINLGLVLFVTQALQILVVAVAVGAFFVAFGALALPPDVVKTWTGDEARQLLSINLGDLDLHVTAELLRVSAVIAALSGLYYSVAALTDSTYREEFLEELTDDLRTVLTDRAAYLELRRSAADRLA
jgi:ABC-type Fe3+ transport system permease subunit